MINRLFYLRGKNAVVSIIMILQILFFIICIVGIYCQMPVHTDRGIKEQKTERYKSIQICPGESLWGISRRYYSDEYKNVELYMRKIMKLNHMSDETINSGAYLLIPYYD